MAIKVSMEDQVPQVQKGLVEKMVSRGFQLKEKREKVAWMD